MKKCHKLRVTPAKDTYVIKVLCAINSNYSSRIELCICCSKNLWLWTVEKKILTTPKIELLSFFSVFVFLPERQIYPALQHVPTAHESVNGPLRTAFKFWQIIFSKPPITTRKPINTPFTPWSQVYTPHLHITKILSVSSTSGARNGSSETGLLIGRKQATRNKPYKKPLAALHLFSLHIVAICTSKAPDPGFSFPENRWKLSQWKIYVTYQGPLVHV